jgi:hypothetical protein
MVLAGPGAVGQFLTLTVNSTGNDRTPDAQFTLVEALAYANDVLARVDGEDAIHGLGRPLSVGESGWVEEEDELPAGALIRFSIPGTGIQVIEAPAGGFPAVVASGVTVDGYTQPGAQPNTQGLLEGNNAQLRIVLDARVLAAHPETGETPDYTLNLRGSGIVVRGLSVLAGTDTANYGMYFSHGAEGGAVQGCWLGLTPDGSGISGGEVAMAAYGTAGGQVFGTNGDGVEDRAEFNVVVAHAIAVQLEETRDIRVSGNYLGVLPDGLTLPPADILEALEGDAIEGSTLEGTIWIGTHGDGLADADEGNVIGGMKDDVIEFYGDVERVVVAGNRIGVGVDGTTPLPVGRLLRARQGRIVIGSPAEEAPLKPVWANVIAHATRPLIQHGTGLSVSLRGNTFFGNTGPLMDRLEQSRHAEWLGRTTELVPVLDPGSTATLLTGSVALSGPGPNARMPAFVDIYVTDPGTVAESPQGRYLVVTRAEGGMMDEDPEPDRFRFDLTGVRFPVTGMQHLVVAATVRDADGFETTEFSAPLMVSIVNPPEGEYLDQVPMQGPMLHVNLLHRRVEEASSLSVHLDAGVPVLTPLALSHPGESLDPSAPWHGELDPKMGGMAFNRQYGFLMDGESDPLPEGHGIRIRMLTATPGLLVRQYRMSPAQWMPMFGQGGSEEVFAWNLMMFHPAYAAPASAVGPLEARYEAYVVDGLGERVGTATEFTLTWTVARGLVLSGWRRAGDGWEVDVDVPAAGAGQGLALQRTTAWGMPWETVDMRMPATSGVVVMRDPQPPMDGAFYRARLQSP